MNCRCERCSEACRTKPGWFRQGEVEHAAKLLNLPLKTFFHRYLAIDWWEEADGLPQTFVLAPAIVTAKKGTEYPANPKGQCVFYEQGFCRIYAARPYECRQYDHTKTHEYCMRIKRQIVRSWIKQQAQITRLLGRPAKAKRYSLWEVGGW